MSVVINNNISSLIAQRNLSTNASQLSKSFEKLSSGYKINRASDDAAGMSISEHLRGQIRGTKQALSNVQDGVNLLQIAEGGLSVISDNLQRIRELCVKVANATYATSERDSVLNEISSRLQGIDNVAKTTKFNKISLLDGTATNTKLQIGPNSDSTNILDVSSLLSTTTLSALSIGLNYTTNGTVDGAEWTASNIRTYMDKIDTAFNNIVTKRSLIGAYQNRLDSTANNLTIMADNVTASESRIRDLDIAQETANMTKYQILQQASTSVLAQANQLPQMALSLLK